MKTGGTMATTMRQRMIAVFVTLVMILSFLPIVPATSAAFAEGEGAAAEQVADNDTPENEDEGNGTPEDEGEGSGNDADEGDTPKNEGETPEDDSGEATAPEDEGDAPEDENDAPEEGAEDPEDEGDNNATASGDDSDPIFFDILSEGENEGDNDEDEANAENEDLGPVWLDGKSGSDDNDGTQEAPVKTFEKAKELLEERGGDIIYLTGTITLSATSAAWSLDGKTLARGDDFHGTFIYLSKGASLVLTDIVLDGRTAEGQTGITTGGYGEGGSLVTVFDGSVLTVGTGAILENNTIESRAHWYPESGGGIFASKSTVNVEGGIIRNNSAVRGGGIHGINGSTINISSGQITGNTAIKGDIKPSSVVSIDYGGTGGGVCAADGTDVNFSGGTISGNSAFERGGGIAMGTISASRTDYDNLVLTMTGGTIANNSAGCAAGGIFLQAGYSASYAGGTGTHAIAYITGGTISGNRMTGTGNGNMAFGGGGIYVNGYSPSYSAFHAAELYLTNAVVSGNSAKYEGGGYAACPVSQTDVELTNGAVFYGNSTGNGNAREIYILASTAYGSHSGNPYYEISPSMLGGGAYRWVYNDGSEVPYNNLKGQLIAIWHQSLSLNNALDASDEGVQTGLAQAKVFITDNTSATRGGGIGSNGHVFIGRSVADIEISAEKRWSDAENADESRPDSIIVELYRDGEYVGYQTVTPDADGAWTTTFANLPKVDVQGNEYKYTVKERSVEGYSSAVTGNATEGFIIENTRTVDISGTKTWVGDENATNRRPASITVRLLADGEEIDSTTVTEEDDWTYSFEGLPKYATGENREIVYTITEDKVSWYDTTIDGYDITNTYNPPPIIPPTADVTSTALGLFFLLPAAVMFCGAAIRLRSARHRHSPSVR